jgi:glycerophosphoryl diester phosphodiesterase
LILGHRGAPLELTENTIASFRRALEEGADGVELDVRRTGDGTLVVFHDDRLRSGERLMDYAHTELRDLASAQGVTMHTLEEVFRELAGQGFLNIELKELGIEAAAVDLALTHLPPASFVFSSFLPTVVRECRRLAPDVPAIFITDSCRDPERVFHLLADTDASGLGLWHEALTPAIAAFFTSRDVPLFVWTVNDPAEAQRFAALGVTGIISDLPGLVRSAIT